MNYIYSLKKSIVVATITVMFFLGYATPVAACIIPYATSSAYQTGPAYQTGQAVQTGNTYQGY